MAIGAETLKGLIEDELARVADARVTTHIRSLLIEPAPILRDWSYGAEGQQYVCWTLLEHHPSNTGIAYCESGFGPGAPWGLVSLRGPDMSIGMDSSWYTNFLQAYFESFAATELPIWRVFKTAPSGERLPITGEGGWDDTWKQVILHREQDAAALYNCDTSVVYERGMTESEFWNALEWRIDRELRGMTDTFLRDIWCDGIRGNVVRPEAGPAYMYGTIWIGKDGQTPMQFTMALPDNVVSKDDIAWSTLVPPEDVTAWLSVDIKRKLVAIDLSKAEPLSAGREI
jgi:hypothetical protein